MAAARERSTAALDAENTMRSTLPVTVLFAALVPFSSARCDDPRPTSRDEYDSYVGAYSMEIRVASCERRSPSTYASYRSRIEQWRQSNWLRIDSLRDAAHRWKLPDHWSVDEIVSGLAASEEEVASARLPAAEDAECESLLRRATAYNYRLERL